MTTDQANELATKGVAWIQARVAREFEGRPGHGGKVHPVLAYRQLQPRQLEALLQEAFLCGVRMGRKFSTR